MSRRALFTWFVWVVALALGVNAARLLAARWTAATVSLPPSGVATPVPVSVVPYTSYIDTSQEAGPGKEAKGSTLITATRSDGSQVSRMDVLNRRAPVSARYIVFASGTIISTDDVREEKTVRSVNADIRTRHRDPRTDCLNTLAGLPFAAGQEAEGRDTMFGYEVIRIRSGHKIVWVAPALGCAQLRMRNVHSSGEVLEQVATKVTPGEPAPEMFEIPARYKDVPRKPRS